MMEDIFSLQNSDDVLLVSLFELNLVIKSRVMLLLLMNLLSLC